MTQFQANHFFDRSTLAHLQAWLDEQIHGDSLREMVKVRMLNFSMEDPEYWSGQSYWNLYDHAKCDELSVD